MLNPKKAGGQFDPAPAVFPNMHYYMHYFQKCSLIISHTFPENFIEIHQAVQ